MTSPIGRAPLTPAHLSLLQTRPTPAPAAEHREPIAAASRERPIPPQPVSPDRRRGSLVNIIA